LMLAKLIRHNYIIQMAPPNQEELSQLQNCKKVWYKLNLKSRLTETTHICEFITYG